MIVKYYHIMDLDLLGKEEEFIPYLYQKEKGWIVDKEHILMDRVMGYDNLELTDSPYKIGNTSISELIKEISEKDAEKFIEKL